MNKNSEQLRAYNVSNEELTGANNESIGYSVENLPFSSSPQCFQSLTRKQSTPKSRSFITKVEFFVDSYN